MALYKRLKRARYCSFRTTRRHAAPLMELDCLRLLQQGHMRTCERRT